MIRIDEIYNKVFWPYIQQFVPRTRMFFCDPFGHTRPENLCTNAGAGSHELNYILFHDQEPIILDLHAPLFDAVQQRAGDLNNHIGPRHRALVHSEYQSQPVSDECRRRGWKQYYYFFHGWAALDWFRGYDRTWLMPRQRRITRSFFSANRIIGGHRRHRVDLMYRLLQRHCNNAHVSFPGRCPVEQQDIMHLISHLPDDAAMLFGQAGFPWNFEGETDHPMRSYELTQFRECAESLVYVATETVFSGIRNHLTEKSFKPIALAMPFVMVSTAHSLAYLRKYGFQTFDSVWDESYDSITDDQQRLDHVADILAWLDSRNAAQLQDLWQQCWPMVQHNHQHFYGGGFEQQLWQELTHMLDQINRDFND